MVQLSCLCCSRSGSLPAKIFTYQQQQQKKENKKITEGFSEHLCPIHRDYWDWQKERKTKD